MSTEVLILEKNYQIGGGIEKALGFEYELLYPEGIHVSSVQLSVVPNSRKTTPTIEKWRKEDWKKINLLKRMMEKYLAMKV